MDYFEWLTNVSFIKGKKANATGDKRRGNEVGNRMEKNIALFAMDNLND